MLDVSYITIRRQLDINTNIVLSVDKDLLLLCGTDESQSFQGKNFMTQLQAQNVEISSV